MRAISALGALICLTQFAIADEPPTSTPPASTPPATSAPVAPSSPAPTIDEEEIRKAMAADQAEKQKSAPSYAQPAAPSTTQSAQPSAIGRFIQSLNPDISAIADFAGGYYSADSTTVKSGDDPGHTGFTVPEVELAFQATVDPYFRADIFLTIPNLGGIEVEEAYLTTRSLPWNFQIKAGIFRAGLGRQNAQHLHLQDFTRRPALNAALLGIDGLHSPGLEINWLVPRIPFYMLLSASAFTVDPADPNQILQTFGGGKRYDFTYVGTVKSFFPLNETTSIYLGLNYAHGKTSQQTTKTSALIESTGAVLPTLYDNFYDNLYGADLYLKWKPSNVTRTYASIAWQTEYFLRHIPNLILNGKNVVELEGGLYSQLVFQVARRWYLGARGEVMGIPSGDNVHREYASAGSVTFAWSEFARVRVYGEARFPQWGPAVNGAAFLQLEASIGAHGAHPF